MPLKDNFTKEKVNDVFRMVLDRLGMQIRRYGDGLVVGILDDLELTFLVFILQAVLDII